MQQVDGYTDVQLWSHFVIRVNRFHVKHNLLQDQLQVKCGLNTIKMWASVQQMWAFQMYLIFQHGGLLLWSIRLVYLLIRWHGMVNQACLFYNVACIMKACMTYIKHGNLKHGMDFFKHGDFNKLLVNICLHVMVNIFLQM